jgi:HNH endonuclease
LTQKIKFSEQFDGDETLAKSYRRQKQLIFCNILRKMGIEVTENNDVILGIFDPTSGDFVNTSATKFLNDFIAIAILKGHFQGNKGYDLEIFPSLDINDTVFEQNDKDSSDLPSKINLQKGKRHIPLALRYKVFMRDNCRCVKCGRSAKDNIALHVDHKKPFSLGGLTILENLQTLCEECNLGKSNKFTD